MHINRKPISESVEDAMKDKNPNIKRMRSLKPQPRTDIVMADALEASDEFDTHAKKVFGDLEKQSKNLTPKEPTTGKKINRKPYTEGFVLNEDLFDDALEEDWSKGLSFIFKIKTESIIKASKRGTVVVGGEKFADITAMFGKSSLKFRLAEDPYNEINYDSFLSLDRNESILHVNWYDKDFTYKDIGGKANFNKAKLTKEMEEHKRSMENDLKAAGLIITQSKVQVGGSPKFNSTWRQAQTYNEALDISNDNDFDVYSDLNGAVYNALADVLYEFASKGTKVSPANMETCFEWFLAHFFDDDGEYLDESLHKDLTGCAVTLSSSAEDYFDEEDDAHSYIGSDGTLISHDRTSDRCEVRFSDGHTITVPFEYLEVDESCLDESKIGGKNSKHIQKASKKSSKLKEAKIEGNDLWQAYGEEDDEPEQDTVYDFANERLFGVNYGGFVNSGNYRATNKFCRDVWVSLIKPKGAVSARKNFYYPDNLAGSVDFDGRESSTESRRAPTSEGISVYLRDESEDVLVRAVADELELDYKIKPIGSYNKTNYKYIATVVIPDYIAEMPIDEYLTTIGKSISDYKGSGRGNRAKKRELVAV